VENNTDLSLVTDKIYRIMLYQVHGIDQTHNISGDNHWIHTVNISKNYISKSTIFVRFHSKQGPCVVMIVW